ncbi:hypothetical protein B0H11DRAFT_1910550 [Mycena galericulata]|nr:hypothetical protein B0H11DRAFT_1910550 [Mycena galericulata]
MSCDGRRRRPVCLSHRFGCPILTRGPSSFFAPGLRARVVGVVLRPERRGGGSWRSRMCHNWHIRPGIRVNAESLGKEGGLCLHSLLRVQFCKATHWQSLFKSSRSESHHGVLICTAVHVATRFVRAAISRIPDNRFTVKLYELILHHSWLGPSPTWKHGAREISPEIVHRFAISDFIYNIFFKLPVDFLGIILRSEPLPASEYPN